MHFHNYYKLDNLLWQMDGFVSDPKQIDSPHNIEPPHVQTW
jgi:hypothetical protein